MPNALTGDFEAVLQIGNGTLDRLLASMHQNGFVDREGPSLPHTVYFRLGENDLGEGERGSTPRTSPLDSPKPPKNCQVPYWRACRALGRRW
jgi:hypothetical protein